MAEPKPDPKPDPAPEPAPEPTVEVEMVSIPAYQVAEILQFLGECPAKHVIHLIQYLLAAQAPSNNGAAPGG